jgi:hypothetical protein
MQFTNLVLAAAAFAASVSAKLILTDPTFAGIAVGTPFNITWSGAAGPVSLTLQNGPPNQLTDVAPITSAFPLIASPLLFLTDRIHRRRRIPIRFVPMDA